MSKNSGKGVQKHRTRQSSAVSGSIVSSTGIGGIVATFILGRSYRDIPIGNEKKETKKEYDNDEKKYN